MRILRNTICKQAKMFKPSKLCQLRVKLKIENKEEFLSGLAIKSYKNSTIYSFIYFQPRNMGGQQVALCKIERASQLPLNSACMDPQLGNFIVDKKNRNLVSQVPRLVVLLTMLPWFTWQIECCVNFKDSERKYMYEKT